MVEPPVYIHPSAQINRSVIGPHVSIGPGCVIQDSLIRDTIIEEGAQIRASTLTASIIGCRARVTGRLSMLNVGDDSEVGFD